MTSKIYARRIIAFIDILGWSDECRAESLRLANAIQVIHEAATNYSNQTKERIAEGFGYTKAYDEIHVAAMSDCLAISVPDHHGYKIFKLAVILGTGRHATALLSRLEMRPATHSATSASTQATDRRPSGTGFGNSPRLISQ